MSDSGSPVRCIDDGFWMNSPSPEAEDEWGQDGEEWPFEIVGEEVDANGQVRYEVDWDGWERADGTTQTWQPMEDSLTAEWRRIQKRRRDAILKDSIDIELSPFSGVDLHNDSTRLRAQAYEEKLALRRRYSPKLEEQMANLLAEKLGPGADMVDSPSPTSAGPAFSAGRGLRLSTVRQHRQKSVSLQPQGSAQDRDSARLSRTPSSSSWSSKSYKVVSASSSGSSPTQSTFPSVHVDTPHYSQSESAIVAPTRDSQDRAPRKRKVSQIEVSYESRQQRDSPSVPRADKGKAPMYNSLPRLEWSQKWTKIARAAGAAPITFVNEVDDEDMPFLSLGFRYLERGYIYPSYIDPPKKDFFVGCDCRQCVDASKCDCQSVSELVDDKGRTAFAYTKSGLFSFAVPRHVEVVECNAACRCGPDCLNRVSQRPRDIPLEIFKTKEKGWGVRASIDVVRGKVLGMYSGKLLSRKMAHKMTNSQDGGYIFDLDGQEDLKCDDRDLTEKYSIDSRTQGNWTHFVNHSCAPNMTIYLAVCDTIPGTNRPYITYVAKEFIKAGTELTMDYDPACADAMESGSMTETVGTKRCFCGSKKCRRYVRMW